MQPTWQTADGSVRLYLGDCLEVLPGLEAGSVDAVVTDPPYGVDFKYESHNDTSDGYSEWCQSWFAHLQAVCHSGPIAISCGMSNISQWKQPTWVLAWYKPAAMGRCAVGFNNWEPILLYGKSMGSQGADVIRAQILPDANLEGHPCPKPVGWAIGIINRVAQKCRTVLDPFMGSGTTGVGCVRTGRKFIGIEKEERYFDISVRRIEAELGRMPLFQEPTKTQQSLIENEAQ